MEASSPQLVQTKKAKARSPQQRVMILPSEDEDEEMRWRAYEPQLILEDPTPAPPATQPISIATKEEDLEMPIEELEKYFFSSSVELTFSPISKHLEVVHEHLSRTFPTDPAISA